MAYDTMATHYFAQHPAEFLAENYVRTRAVHHLTVTRVAKAGAALVPKFFPANSQALVAPAMAITNSDLLTCTQIAGRTPPTAFIGLDKVGPNEYMGDLADNADANHTREVYVCPFIANQIVGVQLPPPPVGNIKVAVTDPLSGCSIFITTRGVNTWFFHANAASVQPGLHDDGRIYMRNLFRQFILGAIPAHTLTHHLDRPYYGPALADWEDDWKDRKAGFLGLARSKAQMQTTSRNISVFGVRGTAGWQFHWQRASTIRSKRRGIEARVKGVQSDKFKMLLEPIPAMALAALPNP